jgi:Transposase and inactivated derivatives
MKDKEIKSLEHATWKCQYHIMFSPKYWRMAIYGLLKKDKGWMCDQKGVEIIQAVACPDHIHMLLSILPKYSVSKFVGYLKRKAV